VPYFNDLVVVTVNEGTSAMFLIPPYLTHLRKK